VPGEELKIAGNKRLQQCSTSQFRWKQLNQNWISQQDDGHKTFKRC